MLSTNNIIKVYNENQVPAINRISFTILRGEFIGIIGAAGSGKTTLLNVLSTIDKVTDGLIKIGNVEINNLKEVEVIDFRKKHLGIIFQESFLINSLNVKENIIIPLVLMKRAPELVDTLVKSLAEHFGIEHILSTYPENLSREEKQKITIVRALIKNPSILFADEPTGLLNFNATTEILMKLQEVNENMGTTICMVTHDAYAASFANRILILKDGMIVKELCKEDADRKAFFEKILKEFSEVESD